MIEGVTDSLHKELVKLADILETCELGSPEYKQYSREYRKVAKTLYPDMYRANGQRKPRQPFIRTLKSCTCGCRVIRLRRDDNGVQFSCKDCDRKSEVCKTQPKARDSWNKTFEV
jgi:hypothetical protein